MRAIVVAATAFIVTLGLSLAAFSGPGAEAEAGGEALAEALLGGGLTSQEVALKRATLPEWRVGDAWLVEFADYPCWVVVVEANAAGYQQGFSCENDRTIAIAVAAQDVRYAGRFTVEFEGVGEAETPTRFYDWPLADDKTWPFEWFGTTYEAHAVFDPALDGALGPEPGFRIAVRDDDGDVFMQYDYTPSLRWWTKLHFPGSGYTMEVVDVESRWRGSVMAADATEVLRMQRSPRSVSPCCPVFEVGPEHDVLFLQTQERGVNARSFELVDPDGDGRQSTGTPRLKLNLQSRYTTALVEDLEPGVWSVRDFTATSGSVMVLVDAVDLTRHRF